MSREREGYGKPLDEIEPLTSGDEAFREKFISWKLPDLTMTDVKEYLKEKDTVLVKQSGEPTYRMMPGPPGGSEALALAHRLGLPERWLRRAEALLGSEHRQLRRMLAELGVIAAGGMVVILVQTLTLFPALLTRDQLLQLSRFSDVGARRTEVMVPFVVESVMVDLLALALGMALLAALIPTFNRLWSVQQLGLIVDLNLSLAVYAVFVGFAAGVGLVAGLYPAWNLTRFQAAEVLRSGSQSAALGTAKKSLFSWISTRKALIVVQFTLSLIVTITALVLLRQSSHMQTADYGFDDDRLLHVTLNEAGYEPLRNEVSAARGVESVGGINYLPLSGKTQGVEVDAEPLAGAQAKGIYYAADAALLRQLRFELVTGSIDAERYRSGRTVVVNEHAAQEFGFDTAAEALGQPVQMQGIEEDPIRAEIVGVMANFEISFLEDDRQTVVFHHNPNQIQAAVVRYAPGQREEAMNAIKPAYSQLDAMNPLAVTPATEIIGRMINPLVDFSKVLVLIALIAVAIGIVGLLSMVTFSVGVRMQEVGIRKAMGATVPSLVYQLASEYVLLVGAGAAIAMPLAWLLNHSWLQNLAVSVNVGAVTLVGGSLGMILLAVATIAPQTVRAALTNPAQVLRSE